MAVSTSCGVDHMNRQLVREGGPDYVAFNRHLARIIDLYWAGKLSAVTALDRIARLKR